MFVLKHLVDPGVDGRIILSSGVPRTQEFFSGGGVQKIQLRTLDRNNGDLGAVAPEAGVLEAAGFWYK
jgi:hypothetical protein